MSIHVEFAFDRDTPNARRFKEIVPADRARGVVGTIYVLKTDLEKSFGDLCDNGLAVDIVPR